MFTGNPEVPFTSDKELYTKAEDDMPMESSPAYVPSGVYEPPPFKVESCPEDDMYEELK